MKIYNSTKLLNTVSKEVIGLLWDYFIDKRFIDGEIVLINISKFNDDNIHLVKYKSIINDKNDNIFYIKVFKHTEVDILILNNNDSKIMILKDEF